MEFGITNIRISNRKIQSLTCTLFAFEVIFLSSCTPLWQFCFLSKTECMEICSSDNKRICDRIECLAKINDNKIKVKSIFIHFNETASFKYNNDVIVYVNGKIQKCRCSILKDLEWRKSPRLRKGEYVEVILNKRVSCWSNIHIYAQSDTETTLVARITIPPKGFWTIRHLPNNEYLLNEILAY